MKTCLSGLLVLDPSMLISKKANSPRRAVGFACKSSCFGFRIHRPALLGQIASSCSRREIILCEGYLPHSGGRNMKWGPPELDPRDHKMQAFPESSRYPTPVFLMTADLGPKLGPTGGLEVDASDGGGRSDVQPRSRRKSQSCKGCAAQNGFPRSPRIAAITDRLATCRAFIRFVSASSNLPRLAKL